MTLPGASGAMSTSPCKSSIERLSVTFEPEPFHHARQIYWHVVTASLAIDPGHPTARDNESAIRMLMPHRLPPWNAFVLSRKGVCGFYRDEVAFTSLRHPHRRAGGWRPPVRRCPGQIDADSPRRNLEDHRVVCRHPLCPNILWKVLVHRFPQGHSFADESAMNFHTVSSKTESHQILPTQGFIFSWSGRRTLVQGGNSKGGLSKAFSEWDGCAWRTLSLSPFPRSEISMAE
jgi:hypothetical protein